MKYLKDILLILAIAAVAGVSIIFYINARNKNEQEYDPSRIGQYTTSQSDESTTSATTPEDPLLVAGLPESYVMKVPYIPMTATKKGGELECAGMLISHRDIKFSLDTFISKYVETFPITQNGAFLNSGSPREYYVGNPKSAECIGCFSDVVAASCNKMFFTEKIKCVAIPENNQPMEYLLSQYIINDAPVAIWVTRGMTEPEKQTTDWRDPETDRVYSWVPNTQCMVLVGFDNNKYHLYDPYNNNGLVFYDRELVDSVWTALSAQAVAIIKY